MCMLYVALPASRMATRSLSLTLAKNLNNLFYTLSYTNDMLRLRNESYSKQSTYRVRVLYVYSSL